MANENKQIIKLVYETREAFEAAASSVTSDKPLMAVIYGETPLVIGVKVGGSFRYCADSGSSLTALLADVEALQGDVGTLETNVSTLFGMLEEGSSVSSWNLLAPFGLPIPYADTGSSPDPMPALFVEYQSLALAEMNVVGVFLRTSIAQENLEDDEVEVAVTVGATVDFAFTASGNLGVASIPAETAGVYPIYFDSDLEKVFGYIVTNYLGVTTSDTGFLMSRKNDQFAIDRNLLGDYTADPSEAAFSRGAGMSWEFEIVHRVDSNSAAITDVLYEVKLDGDDLFASFGPLTFNIPSPEYDGVHIAKLRVDYMGIRQFESGTPEHTFRSTFEIGPGAGGPFTGQRVVEGEMKFEANGSVPSKLWFSVDTSLTLDSSSPDIYALLRACGKQTIPYAQQTF